MSNYLTYPCKNMRITQNYLGTTSHYPHTTGSPADYPIDEGGKDTSKSEVMYCPCDEMKVVRIYTSGTNTFWLESTSKVALADGSKDYVTMLVTHCDNVDINKLSVGQKFKRGQYIIKEGTDGASGYHFHFSFGRGKFANTGWDKNSNGKYVLDCTKRGCRPERLIYIDKEFTTVLSNGGINFKYLPPKKAYITSKLAGKKIDVKVKDHARTLKCEVSDSGNAIYVGTYKYAFFAVYEIDGKYYTDETKQQGKDGYRCERLGELRNKTLKLKVKDHEKMLTAKSDSQGVFETVGTVYDYRFEKVYLKGDGTAYTDETKAQGRTNYAR